MASKIRKRSAVIGVFATREQGQRAVEELRRAGFKDNQISLVMHHGPKGDIELTDMDAAKAAYVTGDSKLRKGLGLGAVAGGLGGGALALAIGLIPGIGPVLSAGVLAAGFFGVGAAIGAAGGGFVGALIGLDFPEEEARYYEQELKAGRVLVGVHALDRADDARRILDSSGGAHAHAPTVQEPAISGTPIGTAGPVPPQSPSSGGGSALPPV